MDFTKHYDQLPESFKAVGKNENYKLATLYAYNAYANAEPAYADELIPTPDPDGKWVR